MTLLRRFRLRAGALLYDWPLFELRMRGHARAGGPETWLTIRNRNESIGTDGIGAECLQAIDPTVRVERPNQRGQGWIDGPAAS